MIEFQDGAHERLLGEIAARLGFDLVSMRLELFGRRRPAAATETRAAAPRKPAASAPGRHPAHASSGATR